MKDISNRGIVLLFALAIGAMSAVSYIVLNVIELNPATISEDGRSGFLFLLTLVTVFIALIAFKAVCKMKWVKCYEC